MSETSHRSLHVTVHSLRYALEPGLPRGQESTFIRRNANNFYSFHMNETWWVDVVEVQHLLEEVKRLDPVSDGENIRSTIAKSYGTVSRISCQKRRMRSAFSNTVASISVSTFRHSLIS